MVLNHGFTCLDYADQNVVQMCPELTKLLAYYIITSDDPPNVGNCGNLGNY